jgi:exopolyphosphatase / guanosine-5'-triphosphate,3'-diphosphate pyrophosphatase
LKKIASIDIGSNTLRLLIVEKTAKGNLPIFRDREIVRLGRGFSPARLLSPQAMENALRVLSRFKSRADQEGVTQIRAAGTGVLRAAENSAVFLEKIKKETRLAVEILSGLEEAQIMAKGVLSLFPSSDGETVIFDIGGGSTEFVFMINGQVKERMSLALGVVGLTEQFLKSDPPRQKESEFLKRHCRTIIEKILSKNDNIKNLIGTAGTVTTLAAMDKGLTDYDPDQINGTVLFRNQLGLLSREILSLPLDQRVKWPGLESGRADIIGAGILLVLEIMDFFSQESLLVSDAGLLEGLIL